MRLFFLRAIIIGGIGFLSLSSSYAATLNYEEYPSIRLRTLDKITARTLTFDAQVGNTIKFGDIFIKIQSCRKPPPVEKVESAAFLQIWQTDDRKQESQWIFSGWMFGSSPSLSAMSHPVYDVWVIDCLGKDPEELPKEPEADNGVALPDEGTIPEGSVAAPTVSPEEQKSAEPAPQEEKESSDPSIKESTIKNDNSESIVDDTETLRDETPASDSVPSSSSEVEGIY